METIKAPFYMVEAAQDPTGEYRNFVTYGAHPPKWLFDPNVKASKGAVGGALVSSNPEAYKWNMIRRNIAERGEITTEQFMMLVREIRKKDYKPSDWYIACKRWVEENTPGK